MVADIKQYEIHLVRLNPTVGSEIQKTRPCIVISPNEMNVLKTVIVVPMTSKGFDFVFRPKIKFEKKEGLVLLDQIRTVDKTRLVKKLGDVDKKTAQEISKMLVRMFEN
ncbi:type II toxin-antitoxin system PemK/MazF family toxin [Sulfurimonas autotrophica]|uniref:mRNA interferase n=1 Tax=Sulfurimonas autotrophica (strain ATCC BAA-671 / DSM 16294 / JCM 11897 / OK10) TaxID=563040 RepID=E0URS7_SULAO|nr:type II toxin-antitoxin system PemK/MazF family toxin [Sulfurimonas autotrophica]ADN10091.1 transcriptional modulator of MazE/toxin, MazF [Sulfurimonas autotrophica DSM 16294]